MLYLFLLFLFGIYSRVDISVCMFCRFTSQFEPTSGLTYTLTYTCTHIHAHKRSFLTFVDIRTIWILWYGFFVLLFFSSSSLFPFLLYLCCWLFCGRKVKKKKMKKYSISNNFVCIRYVILLNYIDVGSLEHKQWMKLAPFAYNLSKGKVCMSVTDRKFTWWCDWFWSTLNAEVLSLPMNKSSIYQRYYCSNLFFDSCTLAVKLDNIITVQSVILLRLKPFLKKQICKLQIFTVMWKESL